MRHRTVGVIVCAVGLVAGLAACNSADIGDSASSAGHASSDVQATPIPGFPAEQPQSLSPATLSQGAEVSPDAVAAAWASVTRAGTEGQYTTWGSVLDAQTGTVLLDAGANQGHTPASITKVLTAFTALNTLDPSSTLKTRVQLQGSDIYLSSDGDLLLGTGPSNSSEVNGRAGLVDLANETAKRLDEAGLSAITLYWQADPFVGPDYFSDWISQGAGEFEGHVGAMAIDAGRTGPGAYSFFADPEAQVAQVFANALYSAGIATTLGSVATAPEGAQKIAEVDSATVAEQVRWMLHHSDNTLADQYCRLSASAAGQETSYQGATATLATTLVNAGHPTDGLRLDDCSGLSSNDRIAPYTLAHVIQSSVMGSGGTADLVRSLPWAGLDGTMARRMSNSAAWANAQAKTGSLSTVSSLAGIVSTSDGRLLVYVIGTENVPDDAGANTRPVLDKFVGALAAL